MSITVWVADWQLRCCGDVFQFGSRATGWERREEGLSHAGYLVELDVVGVG